MEPLELFWNSSGTPKNRPIYLSINNIYILYREGFQEFQKASEKNQNIFSFIGSRRVPKLKDTSMELLELLIFHAFKMLIFNSFMALIGVPKTVEPEGKSSKKFRNLKNTNEVMHGNFA